MGPLGAIFLSIYAVLGGGTAVHLALFNFIQFYLAVFNFI